MPRKIEFIKFGTIKSYINEARKMWAGDKAVKRLIKDFSSTIKTVITDAEKLAKKERRTTIMERDVIAALEKHLGKKHLTWQEVAKEIIRQNPTDLGKISKAINDYLEKQK